jgi:hypothetical protein
MEMLNGWSGFLQADAYSGYDPNIHNGAGRIIEVYCWAHARRHFEQAMSSEADHCEQVISWIRRLTIDNNMSERTVRAIAIGRKNWLFIGSEAAGYRMAVLYSIIASAKLASPGTLRLRARSASADEIALLQS